MKIVHLIFTFNIGGAQTMLVDILNEQIKEHDVNLIIINNSFELSLLGEIDKRVNILFINRQEGSKNPFPLLKLNWLLFRLNADILHSHDHNIVPLLLFLDKKKTMLTAHCTGIPTNFLSKYHRLFSISETVKKDISIRSKLDSIIVYNGVLTSKVLTKQNYNVKDSFKLVCVGRLNNKIKGQYLLIEAIRKLKENRVYNIQLDLIGEGESESNLKELTSKYGLNNQVHFLGLKDRVYIYSKLKDYHLLVQPSLFEGFGLTVAEGMAARLPVLVSDIDGPMEVISGGKYGFSFKSQNVLDLADKIKWIIDNYESNEVSLKVDAGYKYAINNFNIESTAKSYINHYVI